MRLYWREYMIKFLNLKNYSVKFEYTRTSLLFLNVILPIIYQFIIFSKDEALQGGYMNKFWHLKIPNFEYTRKSL